MAISTFMEVSFCLLVRPCYRSSKHALCVHMQLNIFVFSSFLEQTIVLIWFDLVWLGLVWFGLVCAIQLSCFKSLIICKPLAIASFYSYTSGPQSFQLVKPVGKFLHLSPHFPSRSPGHWKKENQEWGIVPVRVNRSLLHCGVVYSSTFLHRFWAWSHIARHFFARKAVAPQLLLSYMVSLRPVECSRKIFRAFGALSMGVGRSSILGWTRIAK